MRLAATLAAILIYGFCQHLVRGVGLYTTDPTAIQRRDGTVSEVETICYTYVTTILVTVEPEKSDIIATKDECSFL